MKKGKTKKKAIAVAVLCCIVLLGVALCIKGGERTDVALLDYEVTEEGILIRTGIMSSAGYVRSMSVKEENGEAVVTFYSTFGLNNPVGSKNEFLLEVGSDCESVLFKSGQNSFRQVLGKDEYGNWININHAQ